MSFNKIEIVSVKRNIYRIHLSNIRKEETARLMNKSDLNEKSKYINSKV